MVKKLERWNKLKVLKLTRLKMVGSAERINTSDDTVMDDVSKQGGIIANINADKDVVLEDAKDVVADAKCEVLTSRIFNSYINTRDLVTLDKIQNH
nr:hypothetical protein [Tanacetum cinerariifolium]